MIIPHLQDLDKLVKKGVGLILLHYAVELPKGKKDNYFIDWVGGDFEIYWSVNRHWPAKYENLPRHPVTPGANPFEVEDKRYYHIRFVDGMKNITPILVALPPKSTLNRPKGTHENNPYVSGRHCKGYPPDYGMGNKKAGWWVVDSDSQVATCITTG